MNGKTSELLKNLKERYEILNEEIRVAIWRPASQKRFLEKNKNSKLVHPNVIRIYRDNAKLLNDNDPPGKDRHRQSD